MGMVLLLHLLLQKCQPFANFVLVLIVLLISYHESSSCFKHMITTLLRVLYFQWAQSKIFQQHSSCDCPVSASFYLFLTMEINLCREEVG